MAMENIGAIRLCEKAVVSRLVFATILLFASFHGATWSEEPEESPFLPARLRYPDDDQVWIYPGTNGTFCLVYDVKGPLVGYKAGSWKPIWSLDGKLKGSGLGGRVAEGPKAGHILVGDLQNVYEMEIETGKETKKYPTIQSVGHVTWYLDLGNYLLVGSHNSRFHELKTGGGESEDFKVSGEMIAYVQGNCYLWDNSKKIIGFDPAVAAKSLDRLATLRASRSAELRGANDAKTKVVMAKYDPEIARVKKSLDLLPKSWEVPDGLDRYTERNQRLGQELGDGRYAQGYGIFSLPPKAQNRILTFFTPPHEKWKEYGFGLSGYDAEKKQYRQYIFAVSPERKIGLTASHIVNMADGQPVYQMPMCVSGGAFLSDNKTLVVHNRKMGRFEFLDLDVLLKAEQPVEKK